MKKPIIRNKKVQIDIKKEVEREALKRKVEKGVERVVDEYR